MKIHFIVLTALALAALGGCAIREEEEAMLQEGDIDRTTGKAQKSRSRLVVARGANGEVFGVDPVCMKGKLGNDLSQVTAEQVADAHAACRGNKPEVQRSIAASRGINVTSIDFTVAFHPGRLYYGQSSYSGLGCAFWGYPSWYGNCVEFLGGWDPDNYWGGDYSSRCYDRYASTSWIGSVVSWWRRNYFSDSCWNRWWY